MNINDPKDVEQVREAFEAYEEALLSNDVPKLEAFFWDSPLATRFGVGEQLYGYDSIVQFRRSRKLNFSYRKPVKVSITTFGSNTASVMYEYDTDIDGVEKRGRQSQTWVRMNGQWKIVSAHISYLGTEESIDGMMALLGLQPMPEWRRNIRLNFAVTTQLADRLMQFPIPEETEPDSVFDP